MAVSPTLSPRDHIAQIRREKFRLDNRGRPISDNPLARDLHNSVDLLSEGLYSKDIHFVLELIQNAEDNQYADGVHPELLFRLLPDDPTTTQGAKGALLLVNNERGLRPEDVEALCAIGQSTKSKRQGYIGEKGIGFKSVFKVTRRPHLFSAGYQFRFDREQDPSAKLGYIVPYWVDAVPDVVAEQGNQTCILLPLDEGQWEPVIEQFKGIAPETILFLNRLEALTIELPNQPPLRLVIDKSRMPLVQLLDDSGLAIYWLHHREVHRPSNLSEEKRSGVDSRTVSIAFPLETSQDPGYSVFAYLPIEEHSGFPFLVNADFLLTSSREAILRDRPWNRWLRDEIAPCFVEGFLKLIHDPCYWQEAYRFIPLQRTEEKDDFFTPTVEAIHQSLADLPVVWALGKEEPVKPPQARLAPETFRALLDPDGPLPGQLLETPLVRPELERFHRELRAIGVKGLQADEARACLQDTAWLKRRTLAWFVKLYEHLQKEGWCIPELWQREVRSLRDLPIAPTQEGRLAVVGRETVYLPEPAAQRMAQTHAGLLRGLAVTFLSADLYHLLETQSELLNWVKRNLANPWTPEGYCSDLVRAIAQDAQHLSPDQLVEATRIVRDLTKQVKGSTVKDLCATLPLLLADGSLTTIQAGEIVTPANLDPETGWQEVFPDAADRVGLRILSTRYLESCCTDEQEHTRWKEFFEALGLTDTPIPWRSWEWQFRYSLPSDMPDGLRNQIASRWGYDSTRGYYLSDVRPPQWLKALVTGGRASALTPERPRALLRWLKRGVDSHRIQEHCYLKYFYRTDHWLQLQSELYYLLRIAPWFPTTKGFRRPDETFLNKPDIREIFGDTVPYASEDLDPNLAEWLGVRSSATTEAVLRYLEQLAERPAAEVGADLLERIYSFLLGRWRYNYNLSQAKRALAQRRR